MLIIIVALKCEFKSWWRVILGFHPTLYVPFLRCHNTALEEKLEKNETECQNLSHLSLVFLYNNMGYYVNFILTTWDLQMKRYFGKTKILKYGFTLRCGMISQMIFIWNHVIHTTFFVKSKGFFEHMLLFMLYFFVFKYDSSTLGSLWVDMSIYHRTSVLWITLKNRLLGKTTFLRMSNEFAGTRSWRVIQTQFDTCNWPQI